MNENENVTVTESTMVQIIYSFIIHVFVLHVLKNMQHFFKYICILLLWMFFIIEKITSLCADSFHKLEEIFFQEYDDVDFQSNSIMKSLIPNGFCFQYISYNKCNKPMCKYRHDVPSKVWLLLLSLWGLFKGVVFRVTFTNCFFFDMYL